MIATAADYAAAQNPAYRSTLAHLPSVLPKTPRVKNRRPDYTYRSELESDDPLDSLSRDHRHFL
jgi:hypothetical protein